MSARNLTPDQARSGQRRYALNSAIRPVMQSLEGRAYMAAVQAASADSFIESIGVNTGFNGGQYQSTNGYNLTNTNGGSHSILPTILGETGIRHVRDYAAPGTSAYNTATSLYNTYGIKYLLTSGAGDPRNINDLISLASEPWAEGVEGMNEPDGTIWQVPGDERVVNNPGTPQQSITYYDFNGTLRRQQEVWNRMKALPATQNKMVVAPAMGDAAREGLFRGGAFDTASIHAYQGSANPGSYKLDATYLNSAANLFPRGTDAPIIVTEAGYSTGTYTPEAPTVSPYVQGKYLPRMLAENFSRGVDRTYLFNLINFYDSTAYDPSFGMINHNLTDKPAMTHVRNLISHLDERQWNVGTKTWTNPSIGFNPGTLDYTLGETNDNVHQLDKVHQLLLQKSNGEYYLALWQEVGGSSGGQDITNIPTDTIRVSLNTPAFSVERFTLDDDIDEPEFSYADTGTFDVPVSDSIVLLKITPRAGTNATIGTFKADFQGYTANAAPPTTDWTPGVGDTWVVKTDGTNKYIENTNTSGSHSLTRSLGQTFSSSMLLDFDLAWRYGGGSGYGSQSLKSGIDLLNDQNNGYRIQFRQGNGNNAANNATVTQIFKISGGAVSTTALTPTAIGSIFYNKPGNTTPNWSHVRFARDASGSMDVYVLDSATGEYKSMLKVHDASFTNFSKLSLVVPQVNNAEGASFDNITTSTNLVEVRVNDAVADESGTNAGQFALKRYGDLSQPLTVAYEISGTASAGTDFNALTGTVTFPANSDWQTFSVSPISDGVSESDETVVMRVIEGATYHAALAHSKEIKITQNGVDLEVVDVRWGGTTSPVAGDARNFIVRVRNNGTVATPTGVSIPVALRFDGGGSYAVTATWDQPIQPGAWADVPVANTSTMYSRNVVVRAIVDEGDQGEGRDIAEYNERNNVLYDYLKVALKRIVPDATNAGTVGTAPPAPWSYTNADWRVASVGGSQFIENTVAGSGTDIRKIAYPLDAQHDGSWTIEFKHTWRSGGTATAGSATLGNFVDVVDDNGTGYRVRFLQGRGSSTDPNYALTEIYTMTNNTASPSPVASGSGWNRRGWEAAGENTPDWRSVRVSFNTATHRLEVFGDLDADGDYEALASYQDHRAMDAAAGTTDFYSQSVVFSQFRLGSDHLIGSARPMFDDVKMELFR